jgi:phosphatidylinositol alpha-1,6-mannosyltransferase
MALLFGTSRTALHLPPESPMRDRSLTIAIVANGFPPALGGAQIYNAEYARHLQARGHRVRVFTWDGAGEHGDEAYPFEVRRERRALRRGRVEPGSLPDVLAGWRPDVVFVSRGSRKLRRVVRTAGEVAPVVIAMHDVSRGPRPRGALRAWRFRRAHGLDLATRLVANSEDTRARLIDVGVPREHIDLVHPGIDVERFTPEEEAGASRRALDLEGRHVLLTVSRLAPNKGHERVLELLPALRRRISDLAYVIVGEGPTRERLEARVCELDVGDLVQFTGRVRDTRDYYRACDVFVMVSHRAGNRGKPGEGFGISYAEAGACGKPVVASTDGGAGEVVVDGETGRLVDPEDTSTLEKALVELLTEPAVARAMGKRAREHVRRFDWRHGARDLEEALRAAAATSR